MAIVEFNDVPRIYTAGEHELKALDNVSFALDEGKFVVILGPSEDGRRGDSCEKRQVKVT